MLLSVGSVVCYVLLGVRLHLVGDRVYPHHLELLFLLRLGLLPVGKDLLVNRYDLYCGSTGLACHSIRQPPSLPVLLRRRTGSAHNRIRGSEVEVAAVSFLGRSTLSPLRVGGW